MRVLMLALHSAGYYPRITKEKLEMFRPGIFGLWSYGTYVWPPKGAGVTLNKQVYAAVPRDLLFTYDCGLLMFGM